MIELLVAYVLYENDAGWGWWAGYVAMLFIQLIMAVMDNK
jgi:hypothetical protein